MTTTDATFTTRHKERTMMMTRIDRSTYALAWLALTFMWAAVVFITAAPAWLLAVWIATTLGLFDSRAIGFDQTKQEETHEHHRRHIHHTI